MEEVDSLTETVMDFLTDPASAAVIFETDLHRTVHLHQDKLSRQLNQLVDIHPDKLPYEIREQIGRALNDRGWYEVAPGFANFYMTLLATKLAERLGLGLVTASSSADQLAISAQKGNRFGSLSAHRRPGRHYEASGPRLRLPSEVAPSLLIDLVVQDIALPENITAKKVLQFRQAHRDELAIFRREVRRLTIDLPTDMPVEALRQAVRDQYEAEIAPAMRSLRRSLQAQKWDAALNGFLKVSFFAAAPTSAAIYAGVPGSLALLAGVGVSLTASTVSFVNQRQRTMIDNPYSYLLSLERM
jgi:hypothetical protein